MSGHRPRRSCLVGRSVGLVLGAGGARAYAHIGVILALEEAGIPIDRIGGTSTGALIAAQYAFGFHSGALAALNRRDWVDQHPLRDYTLPLTALLSGKRSRRVLERWFGDERIEDMWLPFFCVSASLLRAETVVHREGPIAKWVRASASIPGIVPPVDADDGDMLVDGALLNNIPADVMRTTARGPVIAVDVTRPEDLSRASGRSDTPPRSHAGGALESSPADRRIPAILRIILQSTLLPSRSLAKRVRGESDLYLTPPVGGFDMFDWNALERIVDTGYRYGQSAISQWKGRESVLKG